MGLVALEAFGDSIALVCMALAAVYPVLVELSGTLVAENLLVVFQLAAIWAALRARRSGHPYAWIAATGVLTGLATLTHENAIVILIPLAFAVVAAARAVRPGSRTVRYSAVTVSSTGAHGKGPRRRTSSVRSPCEPGRSGGSAGGDGRADDRAVDDPQRDRAAPLRPGLRRDRDHARRHLQPGLGREPTRALQVAVLLEDPAGRGGCRRHVGQLHRGRR